MIQRDLAQAERMTIASSLTIGKRYARKFMSEKVKARFIEPMLLLRTEQLPDGPEWLHELKFDGYRALAYVLAGAATVEGRPDTVVIGHPFQHILMENPVEAAALYGKLMGLPLPDGSVMEEKGESIRRKRP